MISSVLSLESILAAMTCLCSSIDNGTSNFYTSLSNQVNMKYPQETIAIVKPDEITAIKERLTNLETTLAELKKLQYDLLDAVNSRSDTYNLFDQCPSGVKKGKIQLRLFGSIKVLCEEFQGSPWIVVQYRYTGSVDFNQPWHLYQQGFGDFDGEFFIGLEKLHTLTAAKPHELLVELVENQQGGTLYAHYDRFLVGNANESYALKSIGTFSGDAYDFFTGDLNRKFSTFDRDNDALVETNCAQTFGAWWHSSCYVSLNGRYNPGNYWERNGRGMAFSKSLPGPEYSIKSVKIMIRAKPEKKSN